MTSNVNLFGMVEKYLNGELDEATKMVFLQELEVNDELANELRLQMEIAESALENDVMNLRSALQDVREEYDVEEDLELAFDDEYSFGLSEEISYIEEVEDNFMDLELDSLESSLHKMHLNQHKKAAKENVHEVYRKDYGQDSASSDDMMNMEDEELLNEVAGALKEREVMDLRASLKHISKNVEAHQYTSEELDDYVSGELPEEFLAEFEDELAFNIGLQDDVKLYQEIDDAGSENDIISLRASLEDIRDKNVATNRDTEEIEQYIEGELDNDALRAFEEEMDFNLDLAEEVALHQDINAAIEETDIMALRDNLNSLRKEEEKIEKKDTRGIIKLKGRVRKMWSAAAACAVLLLAVGGVLNMTSHPTSDQIHGQFYEKFEMSGVVRSGGTGMSLELKQAISNYQQSNFGVAAALLEEQLKTSNDPVIHFYAGATYQEMERFKDAIAHLEKVVVDKDNMFVEKAEWYLALCYIETNQKKRALEYLQQIANNEDSYYRRKAKKIIKYMK
ncbi:hypothetical protein EYV94_05950 [Puteibacter caeruleilacunae]|nr:hypothetical protein EYV94_05950 [Puteibacter caeruleilacunae]